MMTIVQVLFLIFFKRRSYLGDYGAVVDDDDAKMYLDQLIRSS